MDEAPQSDPAGALRCAVPQDFFQSALNPDQETPEKCLFAGSLYTNLVVEALLPPLCAIVFMLTIRRAPRARALPTLPRCRPEPRNPRCKSLHEAWR